MFFKDTLKAFNDFKNKQKDVWSNIFWYVKVYIFWKWIQYTIHWDKTHMFKKFPSHKLNVSFASSNSLQFYFNPTKAGPCVPNVAGGRPISPPPQHKTVVSRSNVMKLSAIVYKHVLRLLTWKWYCHVTLFWWHQQFMTSWWQKSAKKGLFLFHCSFFLIIIT